METSKLGENLSTLAKRFVLSLTRWFFRRIHLDGYRKSVMETLVFGDRRKTVSSRR